jgi:hypothetical protein
MPACTNDEATGMWLQNDSDAVWKLSSISGSSCDITPVKETLGESFFMDAVDASLPLLVPKAKVTVEMPPEDVKWSISLAYTLGWASLELALDRIASAGEEAAVAALRRKSPAGAALAACALAGVEGAKEESNLEEADATELIVDSLGTGAAGLKCRTEAASVPTLNADGSRAVMSEDLEYLNRQTELLEKVHVRMYAQRASKMLKLGLVFLHR